MTPKNNISSVMKALVGAALAITGSPAMAQRSPYGTMQAAAAGSDFVSPEGLKFHTANGFVFVTDTKTNSSAGTIILPPGAAPVYAAMPGYDIKTAYENHLKGGDQSAQSATNGPSASTTQPSGPASANNLGWNAASRTVTLPGGTSVTFTDNDHLKVAESDKTYRVETVGPSALGFAKTWANGVRGEERGVGGSQGTGSFGGLASTWSGAGIIITVTQAIGTRTVDAVAFDTRNGAHASQGAEKARLSQLVDEITQAASLAPEEVRTSKVVKGVTSMNVMMN